MRSTTIPLRYVNSYTVSLSNNFFRPSNAIVRYEMGWFGGGSGKKNETKEDEEIRQDESKSGDRVDWEGFDKLNNPNKEEPEDRGTIELPANAETVIYQAPDGQYYEISIDELKEADDEGEIEYTSSKYENYSIKEPYSIRRRKSRIRRSNNGLRMNAFRYPVASCVQRIH